MKATRLYENYSVQHGRAIGAFQALPSRALLGALAIVIGSSVVMVEKPVWLILAAIAFTCAVVAWLRRANANAVTNERGPHSTLLLGLLMASLAVATVNPRTEDVSPSDQLVALVLLTTACVIIVPLMLGKVRLSRSLTPMVLYAAVIVANFLVAMVYDVPIHWWLRRAIVAFALPTFALGAWRLKTHRQVRLLLCLLLMFCAGMALYTVSLWRPGQSLLLARAELRDSFMQTGGTFASAITVTLSLPFALRPGRWRRACVLTLAAGLGGLALSFARTFWLTTPVALVAEAAALRGQRLGRRALLLFLGIGVLSLALQGWSTAADYRMLVVERIAQRDFSATFRVEEASGLFHEMASDPTKLVLGAGFGNRYAFHSSDRFAVGGVGTVERDYSHAWYLEVLWTTGLVGLSVTLWFLVGLLVRLVRSVRQRGGRHGLVGSDRLFAAGLLGTVINLVLASFTYHPFGMLLWNVVFGALFGAACRLVDASSAANRAQPVSGGSGQPCVTRPVAR